MKKIQTLFRREFADHHVCRTLNEVTPGFEWVLRGEGVATVKYDGACCAIIDDVFYKRYDAKKGKKPPAGAIPCCDPDPITGHWPHWIEVDENNPADKWFIEAFYHTFPTVGNFGDESGTFEACGPHFNGNPHGFGTDILIPHGKEIVNVNRTFFGIRDWLYRNEEEGIVFWKDGEPQCKIKRSDFGFEWPVRRK